MYINRQEDRWEIRYSSFDSNAITLANRAENIEALRTRLKQKEERLTSETDSRKRDDAEDMTVGYESILLLLAWYSITTLFTAILSPVFLNDCINFFGALGRGMGSLFREFVIGADSFGQLSSGIQNSIISGIVYWLIFHPDFSYLISC